MNIKRLLFLGLTSAICAYTFCAVYNHWKETPTFPAQCPLETTKPTDPLPSMLVLDLAGHGITVAVVGEKGSVYWNHENGDLQHASGWVSKNDGVLAYDRNRNGEIDNNSELFGAQIGSDKNGFQALAELDSNNDRRIDFQDTAFNELRIMKGLPVKYSPFMPTLMSLQDAGIENIDLNAAFKPEKRKGYMVQREAQFAGQWMNGKILEISLDYDRVNTRYDGKPVPLPNHFLPVLRGYGDILSLDVAMTKDPQLLKMVDELRATGTTVDMPAVNLGSHQNLNWLLTTVTVAGIKNLLAEDFDVENRIQEILLRWARVDDIKPDSLGEYFDARKVRFVQKLMGARIGLCPKHDKRVAKYLNMAWEDAYRGFAAELLGQTSIRLLYESPLYSQTSGSFSGKTWMNSSMLFFEPAAEPEKYSKRTLHKIFVVRGTGKKAWASYSRIFKEPTDDGADIIFTNVQPETVKLGRTRDDKFIVLYGDNKKIEFYTSAKSLPLKPQEYVRRIMFDNGAVWNTDDITAASEKIFD